MVDQQDFMKHDSPLRKWAYADVVSPRVARRRSRWFLLIAIVTFALFVALLLRVRSNPRIERDIVTTLRMQRVKHPVLTRMMGLVSWFGFRPQSLVLPAASVGGMWWIGLRREARYLCFAWVVSMVSYTTKHIVKRPRPFGEGILVTKASLRDSSFPSGHTLHYVSFWGFFAYICFTRLRGRLSRWAPVVFISWLIGSVGPSRIYLGHHWLTDVLASYCLGIGYLATLIGLHRRKIPDTPTRRSGRAR
jgi:membrane-associated phospholipid phosphatase